MKHTFRCPSCESPIDVSVNVARAGAAPRVAGRPTVAVLRAVRAFLSQHAGGEFSSTVLHQEYESWSRDNQAPTLTKKGLGHALTALELPRFKTPMYRGYVVPEGEVSFPELILQDIENRVRAEQGEGALVAPPTDNGLAADSAVAQGPVGASRGVRLGLPSASERGITIEDIKGDTMGPDSEKLPFS
jgi:hypothetical protein